MVTRPASRSTSLLLSSSEPAERQLASRARHAVIPVAVSAPVAFDAAANPENGGALSTPVRDRDLLDFSG